MSQDWQELSEVSFRLLDIVDSYHKNKSKKSNVQVPISMHP